MKYNPFKSAYSLLLAAVVVLIFAGCEKEFDAPPPRTIPEGNILTIAQLRALWQGERVRFTDDYSVFAIVVGDEASGNLYRNIHVHDATGAIVLRLNTPGGLYEGDSVRIYLPGTILNSFQNMMQLDSVDVDNNIIKQATKRPVAPKPVTIPEITSAIQGQLIQLNDVEFAPSELGSTFADAVNQSTINRTLRDCNGNTIIVRTSGFANFAGEIVPAGRGSMVALVGQFNNDMQLYIRRLPEVNMTGPRCDGSGGGDCTYNVPPVSALSMDFSDVMVDNTDYSNPDWLNINKQGSRFWRGRIFQSDKYLRATGFNGNGVSVPPTEAWFITPPVMLNEAKKLHFRSAQAFWSHTTEDPFKIYISTNFDGCDIGMAQWTEITGFTEPTSANSNFQWINSGDIGLNNFLPQGYTGTCHVAFRYYSVGTQTTTIDIDNIVIEAGSGGGGGGCEYTVAPVSALLADFSDVTINNTDYNNPSWLNISLQGGRFWRGRIFNAERYVRATAFVSEGTSVPPTEAWLITPPIIASQGPALSFKAAQSFWSHNTEVPLRVFISTNFDGCEIGDATWVEVTGFTLPNSGNQNFAFVNSGNVSLSPYLPQGYQGTYHVAFRYYGVGLQTTTIDIDDITIQ